MSDEKMPRFIQCMCRGDCPGFEQLNPWNLINYVRNEFDVEYAVIHPQLCVDDGDRFWRDLAKPGVKYIVGGCDPKMQRKMYKEALAEVGVDFDTQVIPLDLRNMPTEEAMRRVAEVIEKLQESKS